MDELPVGVPVERQRPGVRRAFRPGGCHALDLGQGAEARAPLPVCLERGRHRLMEIAMLESQLHGPVGLRLTGPAEQLDHVVGAELRQVQILHLLGPLDLVHGERLGSGQVERFVLAQAFDPGLECDGERRQPCRHAKVVDRLAVLEQFEVRHLGGRGDAGVVGGGDPQFHFFQEFDRDGDAIEEETGADKHAGDALRQERFAVDVNAGLELVVLGLVFQVVEAGQVAAAQDERLPARIGAEGEDDASVLVRLILQAAEPDGSVLDDAVGLIDDRHHLAYPGGGEERPQPPLADERPAALAGADKVDHVDAGPVELGELEAAGNAPQRRFRVGVGLLGVGHQAVEVDVGVHLPLVQPVEIERVDREDLDQQAGHVLDEQLQPDRFAGGEVGLVRGGKVDVDPVLELAKQLRRHLRRPLLGIAQIVDDLDLGEQVPQIHVIDVGLELPGGIGTDQEVLQVTPDQRFVTANGRQQRDRREVRAQVRGEALRLVALEQRFGHVRLPAGQLQIGQEAVLVVNPLGVVERQAMIEHVGPERVVERGQAADKALEPVEIGLQQRGIMPPVLVGARVQLADPGVHESGLVEQLRAQAEQVLKLGERQLAMNGEGAEVVRMRRPQVLSDEPGQIRQVGPGQALEEVPAPLPVDVLRRQPVQGGVFEVVEVLPVAEGVGPQGIPGDQLRIEHRRQVGHSPDHDLLLIKAQPEVLAQVGQRSFGVALIGEKGVPGLDFGQPRRLAETLQPGLRELLGSFELLGVEIMEAVIIVVVLGAGDELAQARGPIPGQGEVLHVPHLGR